MSDSMHLIPGFYQSYHSQSSESRLDPLRPLEYRSCLGSDMIHVQHQAAVIILHIVDGYDDSLAELPSFSYTHGSNDCDLDPPLRRVHEEFLAAQEETAPKIHALFEFTGLVTHKGVKTAHIVNGEVRGVSAIELDATKLREVLPFHVNLPDGGIDLAIVEADHFDVSLYPLMARAVNQCFHKVLWQ